MHDARGRTGQCRGSRFVLDSCMGSGWVQQRTYNGIEIHMDIDPICSDMKQVVSSRKWGMYEPSKYELLVLMGGIAV